jgi:hypothetical protein
MNGTTRSSDTAGMETITVPATRGSSRRDRTLDVARAGALVVVVLWHWVFSTVAIDGSGPHVGNPVGVVPGLWAVTWVAQVMPLFFLVGGAVHAAALEARGSAGFVSRRLRRLLLPALPLLAPAALLWFTATSFDHHAVARGIVLVVSPLWFAATYSILVLIAPTAWRAQRRWPVGTPVALTAAVVAVDLGRFLAGWDHPAFVLLSFVVIWAAVHQLGFAWTSLRAARVGTKLAVTAAGYAGLGLCVTALGYPASMVGVAGAKVSNMGPPDAAVVFLGVAQLGMLALAAAPLARFAHRRRRLVEAAAAWSMTVFVWHLAAWVAAYLAIRAIGVPVPGEITADWWLQRPLWILAPAAVAIPLCRATRRFDRT